MLSKMLVAATVIFVCTATDVMLGKEEPKKVTAEIDGATYSYNYQKHTPPIKVTLYSDASLRQDTAIDALRSLYSQMKQGNWKGFTTLSVDFAKNEKLRADLGLSPIGRERYMAGWKQLDFDHRSILYTITYKEHTIFIVDDATDRESPYDSPTFKRADGQFVSSNWAVREDPLCQTLGDRMFDVETGTTKEASPDTNQNK